MFILTVVWSEIFHSLLCSKEIELNHALHCVNNGIVLCLFCLVGFLSLAVDKGIFGVLGYANSCNHLDCSFCFQVILLYWKYFFPEAYFFPSNNFLEFFHLQILMILLKVKSFALSMKAVIGTCPCFNFLDHLNF